MTEPKKIVEIKATISLRKLVEAYIRTSGYHCEIGDIYLLTDDIFNNRLEISLRIEEDIVEKAMAQLEREGGKTERERIFGRGSKK